MVELCVAFKAHQGWLNAVAVATAARLPDAVYVGRVDLFDGDDREALEPYHVAGGWHGLERGPRPEDPAAIVARGRQKQIAAANSSLRTVRERLQDRDLDWVRAVVLTARGRRTDNLERTLGSHAQIHIAEGDAVRDATRAALRALHIPCVDQDEKSVLSVAARLLDCVDADEYMKARRPARVRSWRKEERLAALAAWLNRR